jgi:hypothetical protein
MTLTTPAPDSYPRCSCPHPPCGWCNRPGTGTIAPRSWPGKAQHIERVRCTVCGREFSARAGTLMARSTLPRETVERWVQCQRWGVCDEGTAASCAVALQTVHRVQRVAPPVRPRIISTPCRRSRSRGCRGRPPMPRGGAESRGAIPPWRWAAGACGGWTLARVPRRRLPRGWHRSSRACGGCRSA